MLGLGKKKKAKKGEEGAAAEGEEKQEAAEAEAPKGEGEEGAAEGEEGAEGGGKKKSKKKLIIIAAALVVVLAAGGGGAFFMMKGKSHAPEGEEAASEEGHGEEGGEHGDGKVPKVSGPAFYDMPPILVNLNVPGKQASFIKMSITLELNAKNDAGVVEANLPRLVDSYNTYLRELRPTDLYGSASIYRLREELLMRTNKAIAPTKVKDVLFKELLVQ